MKNFNLLLLAVGLLIWSSQCYTAFSIVGPFTSSAFRCLRSSLHGSQPYSIIRVYQNSHSPAGIDTNALQTLTNAVAANFYSDIYVEICRGIDAASQVNLVNNQILTPLSNINGFRSNYMIYIKVEPSINPDCLWEM